MLACSVLPSGIVCQGKNEIACKHLDTGSQPIYACTHHRALIRFKGAWMQATVKSPNWVSCSAVLHVLSLNGLVSFATAAGVLPAGSTKQQTTWGKYIMRTGCLVAALICLLAALPAAHGQSVTGQISGTVADAAGAIVPGAAVKLTNDLSQQVHTFTADSNGNFIFTSLVPGTYSLHVTQPGFKIYAQPGIVVAAQERVDLHEIQLVRRRCHQHGGSAGLSRARGHGQFRPFHRHQSQADRRHADARPQPGQPRS